MAAGVGLVRGDGHSLAGRFRVAFGIGFATGIGRFTGKERAVGAETRAEAGIKPGSGESRTTCVAFTSWLRCRVDFGEKSLIRNWARMELVNSRQKAGWLAIDFVAVEKVRATAVSFAY